MNAVGVGEKGVKGLRGSGDVESWHWSRNLHNSQIRTSLAAPLGCGFCQRVERQARRHCMLSVVMG